MWYYLGELVAALVLAALQLAWAPWLRLSGQEPALVVTLVVIVAIFRGPLEGVWAGFWGALCLGALLSYPLGGLFVSYMTCGLLVGLIGHQIFLDRLPLVGLVSFLAAVGVQVVMALFLRPAAFGPWVGALFLGAAFTAVLALPLAWGGRLLLHRPPGALPPGATGTGLFAERR